jgi:predicted phage terminase large subunit-like protein
MGYERFLQILPTDTWKYLPHTYASVISHGTWKPYNVMVMLSNIIATAISKGNGRIIVSLPPRHGKSWFISQYIPAWFLSNWPDQRVILSSYEARFAATWGRRVRNIIKNEGYRCGVSLAEDSTAADNWMTTMEGGMMTAGVGGPITGKGFNLGLIDDPHKNWQEAQSSTIRKMIQEWFDSTFYTRAEPGATIIVLMCMTGDTPVLMANGTEKDLKNIRPGDMVATYRNGVLGETQVLNWTSNGLDKVFTIKTTSGIVVKANQRHPFLVNENGVPKWIRVRDLRQGHEMYRVNGESGKVKFVKQKDAKNLLNAEDIATTEPSNTSDFILDKIESINFTGIEEVFDVQIAETENFIANQLVSHNTRWHEDDLVGYLLREKIKDGWFYVRIPAIAEDWKGETDVLGRKPGAALIPERYNVKALNRIMANMSPMMWNALFQQRPAPMEGTVFKRENWQLYKMEPHCSFILQSWDTASKKAIKTDTAFSVCHTWGLSDRGVVLLDRFRDRVEFPQLVRQAKIEYMKWRPNIVLIEDRDSGQALLQTLQQDTQVIIPTLPIYPDIDKVIRAQAVSSWHEARRVFIPDPVASGLSWPAEIIETGALFPNCAFMDDIDAMSQALTYFMTMAIGGRVMSAERRRTHRLLEGYRDMM